MNIDKKARKFFSTIILFGVAGCSMSGSVTTELKDAYPLVEAPTDFQSPHEALRLYYEEIRARNLIQKMRKHQLNSEEVAFLSAAAYLTQHQVQIEGQLQISKSIAVEPGHSYTFQLQSFCVHAGKERPLVNDGFRVGPVMGKAPEWLPKILEGYKAASIPQERAQVLIWALLSGARFDDLTAQQRSDLLIVYPKAPLHFGIRVIEDESQSIISQFVPLEGRRWSSRLEELRGLLRDSQKTYEEISSMLAPVSSRRDPISMGWVKTPEGFFARVKSLGGYSSVQVDVYNPATQGLTFRPSELLAIPAQGQRLAISANVLSSLQQTFRDITDALINFRAGQKLSEAEQELI